VPPIFGIIHTSQATDPAVTGRMQAAAHYVLPRLVYTHVTGGSWMATALGPGSHEEEGRAVLFQQGDLVIAADASLYNRNQLIKKLGNNLSNENAGNAELILRAYATWGSRCLNFLYGDFAFVVLNTQTGEIFCGRDPLGVRPLFCAFQSGRFLFASELRVVSAAFDGKPAIREAYLLNSLVKVISPKDQSPFKEIFRLPPAHYLVCKGGKISTTRYWLPDVSAAVEMADENEYIEMFRELLVNAVNMRCKGVTSLGAELSGGLDSSAVTGIAADSAASDQIPFVAYSNVFPEGTGVEFKDEREFIGEMLLYKKIKGVSIDRHVLSLPDMLRYTIDIQGIYPQQNYNVFNYSLFKAAGEAGTRVLLSGFGGDELVSARASLPWNELISNRQWQVIRDEIFYRGINPRTLLKPGLLAARYLKSRIWRPAYRTGVFTPELLGRRLKNLPLQPEFVAAHHLAERHRNNYKFPAEDKLSARQLFRISMDHLPQRMEYCYAAAAQFGLEYRYPLLDVNLVLACLAFPPWLKQHHGINRYLFRQAITGFVPEIIRQRDDKSGSTIPHTYYSFMQEKEQILGVVSKGSASSHLQEIFDFSRFELWYDKLVKRDPADMNYLNPGLFYTYLMIMMSY
jgi:asparagine synthase (glutamine-hydrolysing)